MKNILYLNNFMLEDVINERNNENIFSQPANNKINGIRKSLEANGCKVTLLSSGLVNNKKFKFYKTQKSTLDNKLIYCSIIDVPLINTMSSLISMYLKIRKFNKEKKIDNIIFYNYKPEVAWAAFLAKKLLHIPITVEYEDGYNSVEGMGKLKFYLFKLTEEYVGKNIDSAILVNSILREKINVPNVIVRGVVDENFLRQCDLPKNNNEKITIVYSGGLDKERGIEVLLNSLDYINYDFELIISGKGCLEYKVIEKKDSRINYLGFTSYDIVKSTLRNADILVNCQLENHDFGQVSFPSKIFEYIATKNRIVSSRVADIEDFAGECFYFYKEDNPKYLADALKMAIRDIENDRNQYKCNIVKLCEDNTYINVGKKILKIL